MTSIVRRPSAWVALVVTVVAIVAMLVRTRGPAVRTAMATRRDLEQHIVASGRVWVPTRVQVSAQASGLVVLVAASEGQRVARGDLLLQIDDAEARAAVEQAKAAVAQANARVEQLRRVGAIVATEDARRAESNLSRAREDLDRAERLAATGAISRVQLDDARRAVDIARAQKGAADAQQIASTPMGADSRVALTGLLHAQAELVGANVRLAQTQVRALQDAVVLTRSVEPGDVVQPSRVLLVLAAGGDTQLVFEPDERNLSAIAVGQKARASADAYPTRIFDAVVSYVAPSIDPQRGSVEVRLRAVDAPSFLRPDMTVSVDLTVATKPRALVIPSDAVRGAASRAPWVLTVEGGRVVRRDVVLGIRGEGSTEIASGIDEGAEVVPADGQALASGQRVRATHEER